MSRVFLTMVLIGIGAATAWGQPQQSWHLTLQQALQKAAAANPQIIMANARVQEAVARMSQAQASLLPQVDGTLNEQHRTSDLRTTGISFPGLPEHLGPFNTFDARARVTMAIFDPADFERLQAARKSAGLSQADMAKVKEDILALAASLYIDAQRKAQAAVLMKMVLTRDQMALKVNRTNYRQGIGSFLDLKNSASQEAQTFFLFKQAKNQALEARLDLATALQLPLEQPIVFVEDSVFDKQLEQAAHTAGAAISNANVVLAQAQVGAQKAQRSAARADFLPRLAAEADYGRSGESPSNGSYTYTVGLQATIPIWEGGLQQGRLKEAKAQVQESKANLKDARNQATVQMAVAKTAMAQARILVQAQQQTLEAAQKSLAVAQDRQATGIGSDLDLARAQASEALAQNEYNEAQASWTMSLIGLLHAQGRLRSLVESHGKMSG